MKGPSFSICHNNFLVNDALLEENCPHDGNIHREAFPLSISSYSLCLLGEVSRKMNLTDKRN